MSSVGHRPSSIVALLLRTTFREKETAGGQQPQSRRQQVDSCYFLLLPLRSRAGAYGQRD
jgi:hypothetical protein